MAFYDRYVLPPLTHLACGLKPYRRQRGLIVSAAAGRTLEVGAGSGLNLPYYEPARLSELILLEPEEGMQQRLRRAVRDFPLPVELLGLRGEEIPLADASVDTIVITYTMCTIPDLPAALAQMRRVLKPGGRLLFSEHGLAPDAAVRRWQERLNPVWRRFAGGCNLNRSIDREIEAAGFRFEQIDRGYLPGLDLSGLRFWSYNYWGEARTR